MTTTRPLLTAALAYAAQGWCVFPLVPNGKAPAVPDAWQRRATRDPEQIQRWWAVRPYNIGIAVGPSGLIVVDLDAPKEPRHRAGCGAATSATAATSQVSSVADSAVVADPSATTSGRQHGRDVFAELCRRYGQPVPAGTYTVATPSGGWHLYYRHPANGTLMRNTKGGTGRALGEAIDTRGHGGYVVAAGSVIGGRPYTVVRDLSPAPLPDWLAAALRDLDRAAADPQQTRPLTVPLTATDRRTAYLRTALSREAEHVRAATPGRRNAVLWGAAVALGQLVAGGELPAGTVADVLEQAAIGAGLDPLEARPTIRSGMRRGTTRPRTVAR